MGKYRQTDTVNIYCISDGEFIKVGMSKNVERRLKQLQTSSARELFVTLIIPCSCSAQAIMRERQIHKSARKHRVRGEWFTESVMQNKYLLRYQNQSSR
jgi:hypothetical protein